ncbi:MAG: 50S ribosomal protein L35 [Candidatus Dojkabacteria bacterium]|nr:50S ribosomal protein L35 [Candidatus Dojkabacteria bacterium]
MAKKTHKSTLKRLKVTATGKLVRQKLSGRNNSHLKNMRKSTRTVLKDRLVINSSGYVRRIRRLISS